MCEGGKLVKKAKEEVPQPFVIGCGGDPCCCSSLLTQQSTTYSTHHSSTSIWGYSIPWPFMLPSPRTDPDKYIWTLCRMPLVWQSSLWWKCCQGGRASTKLTQKNHFCIDSTTGPLPVVVRDQMLRWKDDPSGEVLGGGGRRQEISETLKATGDLILCFSVWKIMGY